jgi:hypothetical protein
MYQKLKDTVVGGIFSVNKEIYQSAQYTCDGKRWTLTAVGPRAHVHLGDTPFPVFLKGLHGPRDVTLEDALELLGPLELLGDTCTTKT